ncbi:MAG TPA: hypothetical protein VFV46_11880 [Lacibacter sp.]|nr:hypothetical protein [Lacibacter sp.]
MKKIKWIFIWGGLQLLKYGLRYRISKDQQQWLQPFPAAQLVNRNQFLKNYCRNKNVLHIGFADAPFTKERIEQNSLLHLQLQTVTSSLYGIDTDIQAVNMYQAITGDTHVAALTLQELPKEILSGCDIVLAGEVLEHIPDLFSFIKACTVVLKAGQELLVTVPNYTSLSSIASTLNRTESVHQDHHWYFSPYTLFQKFDSSLWEQKQFTFGVYGEKLPNSVQQQFPATGDCIIAVFKRK